MISLAEVQARLRAIWRPELYHGHGKTQNYFEGWYFKMVDETRRQPVAIIPGIFLGKRGRDTHAFIQVLDGRSAHGQYHRFPADSFQCDPRNFSVKIGRNHFSASSIRVDIPSPRRIQAEVQFGHLHPWPVSLLSPGIMGPFALLPRMQCYHGVLSMDHSLTGSVHILDAEVDMDGGRGYIEKDWGRGFPTAWIWMQCNHFDSEATSLTLSVATVPWMLTSFRGFIIGLLHRGKLHAFTTYNGARLRHIDVSDEHISITVSRSNSEMDVKMKRTAGGTLRSPEGESMQERVTESMQSRVQVRLRTGKTTVYEGEGWPAALETTGDIRPGNGAA